MVVREAYGRGCSGGGHAWQNNGLILKKGQKGREMKGKGTSILLSFPPFPGKYASDELLA